MQVKVLTLTMKTEQQCSICQKSSGDRGGGSKRRGDKVIFYFKLVHSGAFSYTASKVLFAIKCRERYVFMVFLAIDSRLNLPTPPPPPQTNRTLLSSYI